MYTLPLSKPFDFGDAWRQLRVGCSLGVMVPFYALGTMAQDTKFEKKVVADKLPVPSEEYQLFYLQRDPDENTVIYQLNTVEGGGIDEDEPVNVYWIRYAEGGLRKDLSFIQRTMAYGINHKPLGAGRFELRLVAYKSLPLRLSYCPKQDKYVVFASINGREAILDRIFVRIVGGSTFSPDIAYFEVCGRDTATFAAISERIKPDQ